MEIVKKNLVSIICGVVALAALVAAFVWPLDGYFTDLKGKVEKRAALEKKVQGLLNKQRSVPTFTSDTSKPEADRLTKFPSREIIKKGEEAQKKVRQTSEKVYDAAWQMNNAGHPLVVAGSLPKPLNDTIAIGFQRKLKEALDAMRTERLMAGVPPTEEQLKNRQGQIWQEMQKKFVVVDGEVKNQEQVMGMYNAAIAKLPDQMKEEMATTWKMYIDPLYVMRVPDYIPAESAPTPNQMWWAQVSYWVTTDVAATIEELNANSKTVTTSPVKNLQVLSIPDNFFPPLNVQAAPVRGADAAAAADAGTSATGGLPDAAIAIPDGSAQSPTKRISNNLFDVVQFRLVVDIEADKVPLFLKTLGTNRFLSVIRLEMNPVDSQMKQIMGYVYGPRPVVTLDLDCEAILMRQWTIKHMPKGRGSIREMLGIPDDQPGRTAMNN
jgi:hypothetical protein